MRPLLAAPLLLSILTAVAAPLDAQNMDVMTRWTSFTVVRYAVVGEFTGNVTVLEGARGWKADARVTDRLELTFDWNQNETALVGAPTIRNFPSTMGAATAGNTGCPAPRVTGSYEHWQIVSATPLANTLQLTGTRSFPAGAVLYIGEEGPCVADNAAAKTEPVEINLVVLPAMMLGMPPQGLGAGLSISRDGKSLVHVDAHNGWTWTFTPTGLR